MTAEMTFKLPNGALAVPAKVSLIESGTVTSVDKYTVILEGRLAEPQGLPDLADAVMEALLDVDAEDPFVFTDAGKSAFRVEVVAQGLSQTDALASGVRVISEALTAIGVDAPVLTPSARTEYLAAA